MYIRASSGARGSPMGIPVVPRKKISFPSVAKLYTSSLISMWLSPVFSGSSM